MAVGGISSLCPADAANLHASLTTGLIHPVLVSHPHCLRSQKLSGFSLEEKMPRMWTAPGPIPVGGLGEPPATVFELITDRLKTIILRAGEI